MLRGNSTYTPGYTAHMFPEELSQGICSLNPDVDRAAKITTMEIDPKGRIVKHKVEYGLIRSRAKMTYKQVQAAIEGQLEGHDAKFVKGIFNKYIKDKSLRAYEVLRAERDARGALDLNVHEQRNDISEKGVSIVLEKSDTAHRIIEELMIRTNRSDIELLEEAGSKMISRVHGEPNEKLLNEKAAYLEKLGIKINNDLPIGERVRDIVNQAQGHKYEDKIKGAMKRVMARAGYKPGIAPHFGLALEKYGHFTSPIRRFADLVNHHLLYMLGKPLEDEYSDEELEKIAEHISMTERRSELAEKECNKRFAAQWIATHLGETFNARVVSKNEHEITVRVQHPKIETIIKVADTNAYSIDDDIAITPTKADVIQGIIEFKRVSGSERANDNDVKNEKPHYGTDGAGNSYQTRHPRPRMKQRRFTNA